MTARGGNGHSLLVHGHTNCNSVSSANHNWLKITEENKSTIISLLNEHLLQ